MESRVGEMLPLLAIAVYKEPVVSASSSAVGVRPLLLLSICAGTAVLGCTSNVWLIVDILSARVVEPDGPRPREIGSRVAGWWSLRVTSPLPSTVGVGMLSRKPSRPWWLEVDSQSVSLVKRPIMP